MSWIKKYDSTLINMDWISAISYCRIYNPADEVIGHRILAETPAGDSILVGCLLTEKDVKYYINSIIEGDNGIYELYSEQEIVEIYQRNIRKTKK